MTIDAKDAYKSGKSFRIDATDWNYTSVKLKVTRVGEEKKKQIGLSTTRTVSDPAAAGKTRTADGTEYGCQ